MDLFRRIQMDLPNPLPLRYYQEIYIQRLYQYGYPPTAKDQKEFNVTFYDENYVFNEDRNKLIRSVAKLQNSIREQKIPEWVKCDSALQAMYMDVLADYKQKFPDGRNSPNVAHHSTCNLAYQLMTEQQPINEPPNTGLATSSMSGQLATEQILPLNEWKPMVIEGVRMSTVEREKSLVLNKDKPKETSILDGEKKQDDTQNKTNMTEKIVQVKQEQNHDNATPIQKTIKDTVLQMNNRTIKQEILQKKGTEVKEQKPLELLYIKQICDTQARKRKSTSDEDEKITAKFVHHQVAENIQEPVQADAKILHHNQVAPDGMYEWKPIAVKEMTEEQDKEEMRKRIEQLEKHVQVLEDWRRQHDEQQKKVRMNKCNMNILRNITISAIRSSSTKEKLKNYVFPEVKKEDCEQRYISGWGPGGQKVNTAQNAVQLKHLPTGIVLKVHESRLLPKNIDIAFERMKHALDRHFNGENCYEEQYNRLERERERKAKKNRLKRREAKEAVKDTDEKQKIDSCF